jgi:hypothetical protein
LAVSEEGEVLPPQLIFAEETNNAEDWIAPTSMKTLKPLMATYVEKGIIALRSPTIFQY